MSMSAQVVRAGPAAPQVIRVKVQRNGASVVRARVRSNEFAGLERK